MLHSPFSSSQGTLSPQQALQLANLHLENAHKFKDSGIALALCDDAKAALSRMKTVAKKSLKTPRSAEDQALHDGIAAAYFEHGSLLERLDHVEMAHISYKKAEKWGYVQGTKRPFFDSSSAGNSKEMSSLSVVHTSSSSLSLGGSQVRDVAHIPLTIFRQDVVPATAKYPLPKAGARLESTPQLAYCLGLLSSPSMLVKHLDEAEQTWSQAKADDEDEPDRLRTLATDLTKAFINDELKSPSTVAE
ncbi:hypothetical protein BGZ99_009955, partial [Dissophora globulifera]